MNSLMWHSQLVLSDLQDLYKFANKDSLPGIAKEFNGNRRTDRITESILLRIPTPYTAGKIYNIIITNTYHIVKA